MSIIAETYRGNGRLTGAVCANEHTYIAATPGRMDACWVNDEAGCKHLAINSVEFETADAAMVAFLASEHSEVGHREYIAECSRCRRERYG